MQLPQCNCFCIFHVCYKAWDRNALCAWQAKRYDFLDSKGQG